MRKIYLLLTVMILAACEEDSTSGWDYNNPDASRGSFQKVPCIDCDSGPGLILIEDSIN